MSDKTIYSIGTSNRTLEQFLEILRTYKIRAAIDVRSYPKSKRFPHFNREFLEQSLTDESIQYHYLGDKLGGYRIGGYEKFMETDDFKTGIEKIEEIATLERAVFFCAERLFLNCHRRFISKALDNRGWQVLHILDRDRVYEHRKYTVEQTTLKFK